MHRDADSRGIDKALFRLGRHRLDRRRICLVGLSCFEWLGWRDRRGFPCEWRIVRKRFVDPVGGNIIVHRQVRRRLATCRGLGGADRTAHLIQICRRWRDPEHVDVDADLLARDGASTLKLEDRIGDCLGLEEVSAVGDQALVIKCPFRVDSALGQEGPCLDIAGIQVSVIDRGSAAAPLIFADALQLPAHRVAEYLFKLGGAHPVED